MVSASGLVRYYVLKEFVHVLRDEEENSRQSSLLVRRWNLDSFSFLHFGCTKDRSWPEFELCINYCVLLFHSFAVAFQFLKGIYEVNLYSFWIPDDSILISFSVSRTYNYRLSVFGNQEMWNKNGHWIAKLVLFPLYERLCVVYEGVKEILFLSSHSYYLFLGLVEASLEIEPDKNKDISEQ